MNQQKKNGNLVAIITMCFIFAMISFVTNMAAPFGTIWGYTYPWAGMMGNMMNFAAYLFMCNISQASSEQTFTHSTITVKQ